MTKDELITLLEEVRKIEDALALYSKHIKNTLYLSGFKKGQMDEVQERLNILYKESKEQKKSLKQLIDEVKKGDRNVY